MNLAYAMLVGLVSCIVIGIAIGFLFRRKGDPLLSASSIASLICFLFACWKTGILFDGRSLLENSGEAVYQIVPFALFYFLPITLTAMIVRARLRKV